MKLSEYLLDRIFSLICMLVAALVLLALLWLIETPAVFILFAEVFYLQRTVQRCCMIFSASRVFIICFKK